jgi:putative transferase (TIGR04331 family)
MPKNMVEGFSLLREKVRNEFIPAPKAIMSSISWWFENVFQVWAADSAEKGTMLLGVQHGGNYGIAKDLCQEDIELSIVDRFYSWGWKRFDSCTEVIPMPAPKLVKSKKKSSKSSEEVLYVLASNPRYLCQFPWSTDYWENYFFNQALFISHLSELVMSRLRIRPHREDFGWDVKDRIKDLFPKTRIEGWDIPFLASLNNCSVYICDHPLQSTTFIESLINNKPTILFYNPTFAANTVRDEAVELFEQFKSSSIIFDDPISAARHLNSVYGSIDSWWNEPERQRAVKRFLDRYGKTSSTWLQEWSGEILNVIKTPR